MRGWGGGMALWGMVGVGSTSVIVNRLMRKAPYFPCKYVPKEKSPVGGVSRQCYVPLHHSFIRDYL